MSFIEEQFNQGQRRGPEFSKLQQIDIEAMVGFHRLAINGLNEASNQPITIDNISLICNGEIYNYRELYKLMNVEPTTGSDCEVIIHLYKKYGIEQTLQMLDGVFAFVLFHNNLAKMDSTMYVARDPYGVRPLYYMLPRDCSRSSESSDRIVTSNRTQSMVAFASELKMLAKFHGLDPENYTINHFTPGTYSTFYLPPKTIALWEPRIANKAYHSTGFNSVMSPENIMTTPIPTYIISDVMTGIQKYLTNAVRKRVLITERPIACLLSGGLDSSLITALVNKIYKETMPDAKPLETYSIGLKGSEDLRHARIVADHLQTQHTEIIVSEDDFLKAIPDVIRCIESYDTTTVRASIGNYLLGKFISQHSEAKVIFNGDGSDELCGGYLYMHSAPDPIEFDGECRRLLRDIHAFDVLRSDKCISGHGLEPRTPFLDRSWVQYYLQIHPTLRFHPGTKQCEKFLLRSAFSSKYYFDDATGKPLLPDNILWRKKEAFSDGVSKTTRSLYEIIQDHVKTLGPLGPAKYSHVPPDTLEKQYYRQIFETHYPGLGNVVPYFWMPRYVEATDASARTLEIYNSV